MEKNTTPQASTSAGTSRGTARWLIREIMGLAVMGLILFVSAGRWDWWGGWALLAVMAAWVAGTAWAVIPRHPQLLAERTGPRKGSKAWDTAILGGVGLATFAGYVVAGLDVRNGWTASMPAYLQAAALLLAAAGYAVTVWATASNAFFSQVVRIQTERGHTVATGGPYRFVRHPANLSQIAVFLATPLVLGSWWAYLACAAGAMLVLLRTAIEDRTLQAELGGYKEYAGKVRFRLFPGIW